VRQSLKTLPNAEYYRNKRREAYFQGIKERRQQRINELRKINVIQVFPFEGQEYYYIIHGHGGVPKVLEKYDDAIPKGCTLHFYCHDGETTNATEERNENAAWPKLLNRLTIGYTLPTDDVVEVLQAGSSLKPLVALPSSDI
jgi:hypothetical protein